MAKAYKRQSDSERNDASKTRASWNHRRGRQSGPPALPNCAKDSVRYQRPCGALLRLSHVSHATAIRNAKEIAVLRGHDNRVFSAAFSPDGSRIVTASDDKTARIWDVHPETMSVKDLLAEAC